MAILALETSAARCQVALYDGVNSTLAEEQDARHSRVILSLVEGLLGAASLRPQDLQCIAVCVGPGSFTGLRIAVSIAQGIAYAAAIPVVPVSSLQALAFSVERATREQRSDECLRVLATLDARKQQLYCGWFACDAQRIKALGEETVCDPQHVLRSLSPDDASRAEVMPLVIAGSGLLYRLAMPDWPGAAKVTELPSAAPCAEAIALLGARQLAAGAALRPERLAPVYLRNKVTD